LTNSDNESYGMDDLGLFILYKNGEDST